MQSEASLIGIQKVAGLCNQLGLKAGKYVANDDPWSVCELQRHQTLCCCKNSIIADRRDAAEAQRKSAGDHRLSRIGDADQLNPSDKVRSKDGLGLSTHAGFVDLLGFGGTDRI